ncbi:MAG: hypothetical protein ACYTGG_05955 [Planctomycetota bacterium]|jgi:hypothetical protein
MTRTGLAISISLGAILATPARADVVERRGAEPALIGTVVAISDGGVRLRESSGLVRDVSWDRVSGVQTAFADPGLDDRLVMATDLWRARTRLERRDAALAEPLLARWFDDYVGQTNETALVVTEGLLRCYLARGAHEAAVLPALEVARLRRAGESTDSYTLLDPVLDETTSLCEALPPVWVQPRAMARLERDLSRYDSGGDEVVAALASLYRRAVLRQLGRGAEEADETPPRWPDHPGVELLALLEQVWDAEPEARLHARTRLLRPVGAAPSWVEAWSRLGVGLSLLSGSAEPTRQRGMVALAHVPARFGASHAYLAGIALARMAEELDSAGDPDAAALVRAELARRYPRHPIRQLEHAARADRAEHARREDP